jgi:hypothetical protein
MKNRIPLIVLFASLCSQVFAASGSPVSKSEPPQLSKLSAPPALQWDHHGHIRACAQRGTKNCPVVEIPPGIKSKDILSIVRTRVVPGAKFEVAIMGRKNVYLCASGIGSTAKLLCQKMPVPDPSIAVSSPSPDVAAAHLQNTISLLLNRGTTTTINRARLIAGGGGCGYDEETGESTCDGGGGGGEGEGGGEGDPAPYTNIPDPGSTSNASGNSAEAEAEAVAAPWISMAVADSEASFNGSGASFSVNRDECNVAVARCRDDCGDRTNAAYGMCGGFTAIIGVSGGTLSRIAAGIFGIACIYNVSNRGAQCKNECIFTVIPCGQ